MRIIGGIYILIAVLSMGGCDPSGGRCTKGITLSGAVVDAANSPIAGVNVNLVDHYGYRSKITTTGDDGSFAYSFKNIVGLGNGYLVFSKDGYQEISTSDEPLGDGEGCEDQTFVRNATLTP